MENNLNLFNFNYITHIIKESNDNNLLVTNLDNTSSIEIAIDLAYNYLINQENILILSDTLKDDLLNVESFRKLECIILDLHEQYDIKGKIDKLLELENKTDKNSINKIELVNRNIIKKLDTLIKVNSLFNNRYSNMSLLEKYIYTEKIRKDGILFNKSYKIFKLNNPFSNYNYCNLKDTCNSILSSDICIYYIKYRRFIDNDIFNCLLTPFDYNKLKESLYKLEKVILSVDKYGLIRSKYSEDFFCEILQNSIDEQYIFSLSNLINLKYNYELLNKKKKKKWYDFFNKSSKIDEEYNLNLYNNKQNDIYEEYIYNFNIINDFKANLLFLKDILEEENYNEIVKSLIKDNNLKETLLFYKKLILASMNIENTFEVINKLSNVEMDILNYCYVNSDKKRDMNLLIELIPNLKLCLEIEEEESKNLDIINLCCNYDTLIDSICYDLSKRNSLIVKYINDLCKYKIKEKYEFLKANIKNQELKCYFPCVISNFNYASINKLSEDGFFFKRVIILTDNIEDISYLKEINIISEKIILLTSTNSNLINFTKIDSLELNNRNISNDHNDIIYKEIEVYLINRCSVKDICNKTDYIEVYNGDKRLVIKVSPINYKNNDTIVYEDIHLYYHCKLNNIEFHRVWYRNWWLDKFKELKNIEKLLTI